MRFFFKKILKMGTYGILAGFALLLPFLSGARSGKISGVALTGIPYAHADAPAGSSSAADDPSGNPDINNHEGGGSSSTSGGSGSAGCSGDGSSSGNEGGCSSGSSGY